MNSVTLSEEQGKALSSVSNWFGQARYGRGNQVYTLFGWAGTGKSTIAERLLQELDVEYVVGTFTGKAASVLRRKGLPRATTLHALMYKIVHPSREAVNKLIEQISSAGPSEVPDLKQKLRELNQPQYVINDESQINECDLILVDEVSMVDEKIGRDLLSFGKPILVLGDPGQLPPVGGAGFFTKVTPDILLTEVHRQARDNPIIALATDVRNGVRLKTGAYGSSSVVHKSLLRVEDLVKADQVLVGRNATRRSRNTQIRLSLGRFPDVPVYEDKLIALKNNHKIGLLNGSQWTVLSVAERNNEYEFSLESLDEPGPELNVFSHKMPFLGQDMGEIPWYIRRNAEEFDFGNAVTCHKAQGSQWDHVVIDDESWVFRDDRTKWLYTALTRASLTVKVAI